MKTAIRLQREASLRQRREPPRLSRQSTLSQVNHRQYLDPEIHASNLSLSQGDPPDQRDHGLIHDLKWVHQ